MTYNEKRSLYESIMKEVAKTVKQQINEAGIADISSLNKNGKANLSSNKEGKVNMPLSKENFSYKMIQIIYNVLLHNNQTDFTVEDFAETTNLFRKNPKYQQIFFDMLYETLTTGSYLKSAHMWRQI